MGGPVGIGVLALKPGRDLVKFDRRRRQRQAILKVYAAIAQREKLAPE